jgi:hypothetical protein
VCLTNHDTLRISTDQGIDVSMRTIYAELVDIEPLYGYCLFWLGVSSPLSFSSSLSCLVKHYCWRSQRELVRWLDYAALVGGMHVSE